MVTDFLSAPFLQSACAKKAAEQIIRFTCGDEADPTIQQLVCTGDIIIESTKDGSPVTANYSAGTHDELQVSADANTEVVIRGNVTDLYVTKYNDDPDVEDFRGYMSLASINISECPKLKTLCIAMNENVDALDLTTNTALQTLNCDDCPRITALDLTTNVALQTLDCSGCTGITALDLTTNVALQTIDCNGCTGITALDLTTNTALQTLDCSGCTGLTDISYSATNSSVSTAIAAAITAATAADGTVTTDSAGAHYSTIADAATAKGWTIAQL